MRVISGTAGGIRLKFPKGPTRPAMDRVKASLFSILSSKVEGSRFLDLFAGSGNLGIEALSRGASTAIFVDNSIECVQTIKENLRLTRFEKKAKIFRSDCLKFLMQFSKKLEPFNLVSITPPYLKGLLSPIIAFLPKCPCFFEETIFIIENSKHDDPFEKEFESIELLDRRNFGNTILTFFKVQPPSRKA